MIHGMIVMADYFSPSGNLFVEDQWLAAILEIPSYKAVFDNSSDLYRKPFHHLRKLGGFFYVTIPDANRESITRWTEMGFYLADTKITLTKNRFSDFVYQSPAQLDFSEKADEAAVMGIARRNFRYSRFHRDPNISREKADYIQAAWAQNFFLGRRGTRMVVARVGGKVAGFNLIIEGTDGVLTIDLIAVDKIYANRKIASDLMIYAEELCSRGDIFVSTQEVNEPAVCLYRKLGYRVCEVAHVLHFWSTPDR